MTGGAWPSRLVFRRQAGELRIEFDDGQTGVIAYPALRRASPSAEVRGHGSAPPPPQPPVPEDIQVIAAEPVGRYAVRIRFSDGHSTGLYTWSLLRALATGR